jgi:hypothetical protein
MDTATDPCDRQLVSVALAMCAYGSEEIESAKAVLFQRSVQGCFRGHAICLPLGIYSRVYPTRNGRSTYNAHA